MFLLAACKQMKKRKNLIDRFISRLESRLPADSPLQPDLPVKAGESTRKQQVLEAVRKRGRVSELGDLPFIEEELLTFFRENANADYFTDLDSTGYYRLLDLRSDPDARVVVIGDIHCDFYALSALLLKLSVSKYNYFEKAWFVFLGDYLDRGAAVFEPLLLLMDMKRILGHRMIMLRGNHELISYDPAVGLLDSRVIPQDTCPLLNEICSGNKAFMEGFGNFFSTLPTYVWLKVADQSVLLTHAAVPRQIFLDMFRFDPEDGSIAFDPAFLNEQGRIAQAKTEDDSLTTMSSILRSDLLRTRNQILYDMIWGDPSHDVQKYQVAGRFQFGSGQFEAFASKNGISRLFRSHEPVRFGFESFFGDRLFTVFSSGGDGNDQAGYADITPAFAVVCGDGSFFLENSFIYRIEVGEVLDAVCNLFTGEFLKSRSAAKCSLRDEFVCDEEAAMEIEALFVRMKEGFEPEPEKPDLPQEPNDSQAVPEVLEVSDAPADAAQDAPDPVASPEADQKE